MQTFVHLLLCMICTSQALPCRPGTYYDEAEGRCLYCAGGYYGSFSGMTTANCQGECNAGYFCPLGSKSPTEMICGGPHRYCPKQSEAPTAVLKGYYTTKTHQSQGLDEDASVACRKQKEQMVCEKGYYCVAGIRRPCPAGRYGQLLGNTDSNCTTICPKGHYCPEAAKAPTPCPAGRYGNTTGLKDESCTSICPKGSFCPAGSIEPTPCPAGLFGNEIGLTNRWCSTNCGGRSCIRNYCPKGYYCPVGTTAPLPCGKDAGRGVYCPTGSRSPKEASEGYYTISSGSSNLSEYLEGDHTHLNESVQHRIAQLICPPGTYCTNGYPMLCPKGYYGTAYGVSTSNCSGLCPPGVICPAGTSSIAQNFCLNETSYCPAGSHEHTIASAGYYTIGSTPELRESQVQCEVGHYCKNGVKYLCPHGTYGDSLGLSTASCSGPCDPGHICPPGTIASNANPCSPGTYTLDGITCSPCFAGYWCGVASSSPFEHDCGAEDVYCPSGASAPIPVSAGFYSTGGLSHTRQSQSACRQSEAYFLPQCPSTIVV